MLVIRVDSFLDENPTKTVFFEVHISPISTMQVPTRSPQIKSDGFAVLKDSIDAELGRIRAMTMVPTFAEIDATLEHARVVAGSLAAREVVVGTPKDFGHTDGDRKSVV